MNTLPIQMTGSSGKLSPVPTAAAPGGHGQMQAPQSAQHLAAGAGAQPMTMQYVNQAMNQISGWLYNQSGGAQPQTAPATPAPQQQQPR
jgi:hypothetical protein